MSTTPVHHLAIASEWDEAVARGGPYTRSTIGADLAEVGFIHCSTEEQLGSTAERFYSGRDDVVVLHIDPDRLDVELRVEDLTGSGESFPHLYGPLPLGAVVGVDRWRWPDQD